MRPASRVFSLVCVATLLAAVPVHAQWRSLRTEAFTVFYPAAEDTLARAVLARLEAERPRVEALTGWSFVRFPVVIEDLGTYSNGLANPVFRRIGLYPYEPDTTSEIGFSEDWLRSLVIHEMTHIGQLSAAHGVPAALRFLFGPSLAAGLLEPAWLTEGLAVYVESGSSPYEGRLNDGFYDALVGLNARAGTLPSLAQATFSEESYPFGTSSYLFGAAFVRYLVSRGGEDGLGSFLDGTSGSVLSYLSPLVPAIGMDAKARRAWGERLPRLWDEWREWEAGRAPKATAETPLGSAGASEISGVVRVGEDVYYARADAAKTGAESYSAVSRIVRVDEAGHECTVAATPSGFTGAFVIRDGLLYYAVGEVAVGYANISASGRGMTSALRVRDLRTGRDRELLRAPLRCFTVLPDGRVLYAVDSDDRYGSAIWELRPGESRPRVAWSLPIRVFEAASDSTSIVLCARASRGNTDLYLLDIAAMGSAAPRLLVGTEWSEETISLHDGLLAYTTNPDGRHVARGMDLATGASWTYETGPYAAWPWEDAARGTLTYAGLTASGPRLMVMPASRTESGVTERPAGPSVEAATPSLPAPMPAEVRETGCWPNLLTLVPRIRLPLVTADQDSFRAGVWLDGQSALGDLAYDLQALYDPDLQSLSVEAELDVFFPAPVDLVLEYTSADAHALDATLSLTVFRGLQTGLASAGVELVVSAEETFSRFPFGPGLWMTFRAPLLSGGLSASATIERVELGCAANGTGVLGTVWAEDVLGGGELEWVAQGWWDSAGRSGTMSAIRGHTAPPAGSPAGLIALSYEHVLLKVRTGTWNPALYLGDVTARAFAQAALSPEETHLAVGVGACVEMRAFAVGTGLPFLLQGWVGADEDFELIWGVSGTVEADLLSGGRSRASRRTGLCGLVLEAPDMVHWWP